MEKKKDYNISISAGDKILEIVLTGELTKDAIGLLHAEVMEILKKGNVKAVLVDVRTLKAQGDDFGSAFFRVRSSPSEVKKMHFAIVVASAKTDYMSFYETTSANIGQAVRWFDDIEAARTWLKSKL